MALTSFHFIVMFFILIGVIYDFKTRRIPNLLNLLILVICLVLSAVLGVSSSFLLFTLGVFTSFGLGTISFALRILGGGDIKLLLALSPLFGWQENIELYFYSFLWGAGLGLVNSLLKNESKLVLFNLFSLIKYRNSADIKTSPIPFSVAILFGYLSLVLAQAKGISLL